MCSSGLGGLGSQTGSGTGSNYSFGEGNRRGHGRGFALSAGRRHGGEFLREESPLGRALELADLCVCQNYKLQVVASVLQVNSKERGALVPGA